MEYATQNNGFDIPISAMICVNLPLSHARPLALDGRQLCAAHGLHLLFYCQLNLNVDRLIATPAPGRFYEPHKMAARRNEHKL